jgi:predicted AlkP superfamily pyrophosphatase or phosphodiesterase
MNTNRVLRVLSVVAVLAMAVAWPLLRAQQPDARHVVMMSIDGLQPSAYAPAGPSKVPALRRLAQAGAYAEGVVAVTPTVTYPAHTTIVTGVLPAVHGIYNNRILDPENTSNGSWYWYSRDIKVPTLAGVLKARGMKTAAVSWPATVGAEIDYLVPEYGGVSANPKSLELIRALSSPRGVLEQYEAQGTAIPWPMSDRDRTALAAWIFRTYRPQLLMLHIYDTDDAMHTYGPGSPEALASIEEADARVQEMLKAVTDAGLQNRTDIVIVSDHGFLPLAQQLQPNHAFKREGLLEVDDAGRIRRWDAYYYTSGGAGFVILRNAEDAALRDRVAALLQKLAADPANGILTVWNRDDLAKAGADPRASFGIDMRNGFYSSGGHTALFSTPSGKGGHGFAPTRPELHASLVMSGPDVPKAGSLGVIRMSQIGPTIASWFQAKLSPQADRPITWPPAKPGSGR